MKQVSTESRKEPEKKAAPKHSGAEQRTSHLSQAHLLAGAVKRRRYADTHPLNLQKNIYFCLGAAEHAVNTTLTSYEIDMPNSHLVTKMLLMRLN